MRFLSKTDFDAMIVTLGSLVGLEYSLSSLDVLFAETAGHPQIARDVCSHLVGIRNAGKQRNASSVTDEDIYCALKSYLGNPIELGSFYPREILLDDRYHPESVVEPQILRLLSDADRSGEDIAAHFAGIGDQVLHELGQALRRLEDRSIIALDPEKNGYRLTIPVLKEWVKMNYGEAVRYDSSIS